MDEPDSRVVDPRVVKGRMTPEEARKEREKDAKVQAMLDSAVADVRRKDYDQAIRRFEEALKLKPEDKDIRMDLCALLHARDRAQGKSVSNPKVEAILDAFEYGRGDWGKSLGFLQGACKANPSHLGFRDALAFVQGMSGYFREPDPVRHALRREPAAGPADEGPSGQERRRAPGKGITREPFVTIGRRTSGTPET